VEEWMLRVYSEWWKCDKVYKDMLHVKESFPKSTIPAGEHLPPEETMRRL